MKRTKLRDRVLPRYSIGEEVMNMVTHIVGGAFGIIGAALCMYKTIPHGGIPLFCALLYGSSMILLYTMSSVYHALRPGTAKKVLQVLDHCSIYGLIAGTYTPIVLCALAPKYPAVGCGLFAAEWILAIIAATLTAIDLRKYKILSMVCYIGMGWGIIFFLPQITAVLPPAGFGLLLAGGIAYTIGAVLFGLGKHIKWMHSLFHIFVVAGSVLQFLTIILFVF